MKPRIGDSVYTNAGALSGIVVRVYGRGPRWTVWMRDAALYKVRHGRHVTAWDRSFGGWVLG